MSPAPVAPRPHGARPQGARYGARRHGFTLIEVLIVVGIIAVLAGLLLTVRSRATDKAMQAQCMNNLRQVGLALISYAQENEQVFPFSSPLRGSITEAHPREDWVHWRVPSGTTLEQVVNKSAIGPYVGAKGHGFISLLRCPADEIENHIYPYPYSYGMNYIMTPDASPNVGPPPAPGKPPTPRLSSINRASEKILAAEENERTINDGLWAPGNYTDAARKSWIVQWDYLSVRHDTRKAEFTTPEANKLPQQTKRGNVVFVDGHADFVSRKFAHSPQNLLPNNEGTGVVPPAPAGQ